MLFKVNWRAFYPPSCCGFIDNDANKLDNPRNYRHFESCRTNITRYDAVTTQVGYCHKYL